MATTGHETEAINVQGLKASLQKLKTDIIDPKYVKPSGGIPDTDLSSGVQASLGKADTALQNHQSKADLGLDNVTNDAQVKRTEMGVASGVATLDESGFVPSTQLPSYVDDVIDLLAITNTAPSTCAKDDLYFNTTTKKVVKATAANTWGTSAATNTDPEKGKIYVNLTNGKCYRWSGSAMVEISSSDVTGIKVGSSGSTLTPSQGVITIPAYETNADVTDAENVKAALGTNSTHGGAFLRKDGTWQVPTDNNTTYKLNINGTDQGGGTTSLGTVFAPTAAGTAGQVLLSSGGAPNWKTGDIIHYITNPSGTAGSTASGEYNRTQWTGDADGVTALYTGLVAYYKIPVAGVKRGCTLNINSLGEHPVVLNASTLITGHYPVGSIIPITYDADQTASVYVDNTNTEFTGCWKISNYDSDTDTDTIPQGYCGTSASTAAKVATCTNFSLANKSYIMVDMRYANTKKAALTLNINSTGAKAIYINGTASSASNYTLPAGSYLVYYEDDKYYFRTDGKITGNITGDAATVNGKTVAENVPSSAKFTDTTYKFTIGETTKGDSTNGTDLGTLKSETAAASGTTLSLVTTGEKATWNGKQDALTFNSTPSSSNKVATMADVPAAQVQSDWNATTGMGVILNKPSSLPANGGNAATVGGFTVGKNVPSDAVFTDNDTTYKLNVNGTDQGGGNTSLGTVYAPTSAGTQGQMLIANASGVPAWSSKPSYAYSEIGYTVNPVSNSSATVSLAGTTPLHVVTTSVSITAVTLSVNPAEGHSCHVIFANSGSTDLTVQVTHDSTNRVCPGGTDPDPLTIPAGGYVEVDFLAANSKVYVRGV